MPTRTRNKDASENAARPAVRRTNRHKCIPTIEFRSDRIGHLCQMCQVYVKFVSRLCHRYVTLKRRAASRRRKQA